MYGNKYTITDNGIVPCDTMMTHQGPSKPNKDKLTPLLSTALLLDFTNQTKHKYPFMTKRFYVLKLST